MTATIYGPAYSSYTRTARLVFEEKGAPYELVEVDILRGAGRAPEHLARNPFGQVPTLDHDGFALYETGAVARYLDRVLPSPRLTPEDPRAEARMNQAMGIVDGHLHRAGVVTLFIQRVVTPMMGGQADEAAIAAALPAIRTSLAELDRIVSEGGGFVAGGALSLGDLHLAPVMAYLMMTPEVTDLMGPHADLRRWWETVSARPSMARTAPRFD